MRGGGSQSDAGGDDADGDGDGDDGDEFDRATVSTDGHNVFAIRTKKYKLVWDATRSRLPSTWMAAAAPDVQLSSSSDVFPTVAPRDGDGDGVEHKAWQGAALFDLKNDPHETRNIIASANQHDEVQALLVVLGDYWSYVGYHRPRQQI